VHRPRLHLLATGGTIAGASASATQYVGYRPAVTPVDALLAAVPALAEVADITGEQVAQVASQDMTGALRLALARRINALLATDTCDGVLVTHGTNTLEETAYFLNLTVRSRKPVVLVGAMRPANALSADGPMNLFRAAVVAASEQAAGRGVVVVMNDRIIGARDLHKADTMTVDAFSAPLFGVLGLVSDRRAHFYRGGLRRHTADSAFDVRGLHSLPIVHIAYGHEDDDGSAIDAFVAAGAQGIVHAGAGTASVSQRVQPAILEAVARGVVVVRAPRGAHGLVARGMEFDDEAHGTVAGDTLSPPKARVLLQLALMQTHDPRAVQRLFDEH
jgi:L-asparaginase type II